LRQGRRRLEDPVAAALRELPGALREGLGSPATGRRAGTERGVAELSARSAVDGELSAVSGNAGPAVPGAEPRDGPTGERSPLMSMPRIIGLACALAVLAPAPALAQNSVQERLAAYRDRVERLEAEDAIENLQATFGYYFDKGLWNEAAELFANDASFEYGQRGVYVGKDRIRRAMLLFGPEGLAAGRLNNHMQLQSIITVAPDGRTATARWQGMIQLAEPGANGIWGVGIYENAYVKDRGAWKISKLHFYPVALTDYDLGFMRSALRMEGPSALFPPDHPPTEVYRTFPAAYIPPFSFDHPVTGQSLKDIPQPADDVVGRP